MSQPFTILYIIAYHIFHVIHHMSDQIIIQVGQGTVCVGDLSMLHPLDAELRPILLLTVSVQDSRGLTEARNLEVQVTDVNEPPSVGVAQNDNKDF